MFYFFPKHEPEVSGELEAAKKKRKIKDPSFGSEDDDDEDEEEVEEDDEDGHLDFTTPEYLKINITQHEDTSSSEWEAVDVDGDCIFCYLCLNTEGIPVFVCDNEGCHMAVHHCCERKDKSMNMKCLLKPDDEKAHWNYHYCTNDPKLIPDPIAAFNKLVQTSSQPAKKKQRSK